MRPPTDVIAEAWAALGDPRRIVLVTEVSAMVSTNRVMRIVLDDDTAVVAKVSSYGSYYLFREDHDRLHRTRQYLQPTRFAMLLADVLTKADRVFTHYTGSEWVAFYQEVQRYDSLPPILDPAQVDNLAEEIAEFHLACHRASATIPPTATSLTSDVIYLLDLISERGTASRFSFSSDELDLVRRHCDELLESLDRLGYEQWARIPVLVDWNLGNFSVIPQPGRPDRFRLFSRWDYDWFRIEPRQLDFYFLSRVSSQTGDRTVWTYGPHTFTEPRFLRFLKAYHGIFPLSENEVRFLPEAYRFFILNYVIRAGSSFFQPTYCTKLQRDAVTRGLPALDRFDVNPLLDALW